MHPWVEDYYLHFRHHHPQVDDYFVPLLVGVFAVCCGVCLRWRERGKTRG